MTERECSIGTPRIATLADIPAMQRVRNAVRENRLTVPGSVTDADCAAYITRHGRGWVVEEEGTLLGFAVGDARDGNIWALFVDPDQERRGIGRALHDTMVDWLFAQGLDRLHLGTEPGTRAQRFYERAGWRFTGMHRGEAQYELLRASRPAR